MAPVRCKRYGEDAHELAIEYYYSFAVDDVLDEQSDATKEDVMAVMRAVIKERTKK